MLFFIPQKNIHKIVTDSNTAKRMKKLLPMIFSVLIYTRTKAQTPSDSTMLQSPLKTLTNEQYTALITGKDIYGMSLAAELNHYPLPEKAVKYKKELNLTTEQVNRITAIDKELTRKKLEMGRIIIHNERALDSIFVYNRLDSGSLIFYANRYGLYQGELRNAILQACLATANLLTHSQIRKLDALQKAK